MAESITSKPITEEDVDYNYSCDSPEDDDSVKQKSSDQIVPRGKLRQQENESQVHLVLTGKSGAGKSTLARNILDIEDSEENNPVSAGPITDKCQTHIGSKNGVTIKITDTVGLNQSKATRKERLKEMSVHTEGKADVLVYCLSVELSSKFEYANPEIIKSIHSAYGKDIWKHCVVALTFSNSAWNNLSRKTDAIHEYKKLLNHHAAMLQEELKKLEVQIKLITIFDFNPGNVHDPIKTTITAIPTGNEPDDPVLPDLKVRQEVKNWKDVLILEIIRSCKSDEIKKAILEYRFGTKLAAAMITAGVVTGTPAGGAVGGAVGAAIGAGVGAVIGLVGGPFGIVPGATVGAIAGAVVGGAAGAGMGGIGGALAGAKVLKNKIKEKMLKLKKSNP